MKNSHATVQNLAASEIREHLPDVEPDEKPSKTSRMPEASAETKAVAAILHDLRLERCLTVAQLAAHSGLAELDVAELEGARREATVLDLVALARSLGTSVEDILRRARV